MIQTQVKMELYKITEMKDGCVYKTKLMGEHWLPIEWSEEQRLVRAKELGGDLWSPLSTSRPFDEQYRTIKI